MVRHKPQEVSSLMLKLNIKLFSRIGKKCICFLTILAMLTSSVEFIPKAYAAGASGVYNNLSGSPSVVVDSQTWPNDGPTDEVSAAPNLLENTSDVTDRVYAKQSTPGFIDQEIYYPALTDMGLPSGEQTSPASGVFMKHVVHMPKEIVERTPFFTETNTESGEQDSEAYLIDDNIGVNNSEYERVEPSSDTLEALPDSLVINHLKKGVSEDDLYLIDFVR